MHKLPCTAYSNYHARAHTRTYAHIIYLAHHTRIRHPHATLGDEVVVALKLMVEGEEAGVAGVVILASLSL